MTQYEQERRESYVRSEAMGRILQNYFGVTFAEFQDDGTILCAFEAQSTAGKEKRVYPLSSQNSPEENMEILAHARRQQAWYSAMRDTVQAPDLPESEQAIKLIA